jgi:hypothetical protein
MTDIWNCASKVWDLIVSAKKHIDAGEIGYGADEFVTARLNLNEAMEFLDDIMCATVLEKPANLKMKPIVSGDPEILFGDKFKGFIHAVIDSYPGEKPSADPERRLRLPGEHIAELP